jgi:hypothetical protein
MEQFTIHKVLLFPLEPWTIMLEKINNIILHVG